MTITMTIEQYNAIRQLKYLAGYYIDDMEPSNAVYATDKEDLDAGLKAITEVDKQNNWS